MDQSKNKTKTLADYPSQLTDGRAALEGSFVACLWKNPELYGDYFAIQDAGRHTLMYPDGAFYFALGKQLYVNNFKSFDEVSVMSFLDGHKNILDAFKKRGGYKSIHEIMNLVDADNADGYYDTICKQNMLMQLHDKGFNVLNNIEKFAKMSNQDVYDWFDFQLQSIAIKTSSDFKIQDLKITDQFLDECNQGLEAGISYRYQCPRLDHITMGLPLGELYMFAGFSGTGKSSFVFENMIVPIAQHGTQCAVISNEMRIKDFQMLLLEHILTHELNCWSITRKRLKAGGFTEDQKRMLQKAKEISETQYQNIKFVKLFDNDFSKVQKIIRKLSKMGTQIFFYDTMKSEDEIGESMWQQLLIQSRKLFQLASKENVSVITSYQLALASLNKRYLDATCLSNAKQIKEVYSEMVYCRYLWEDERAGGKYDVKPYVWKKNAAGKSEKEYILLNDDKKYIIVFLDKTRNDEDKQTLLYEVNGAFNTWSEVGYCSVRNDHRD